MANENIKGKDEAVKKYRWVKASDLPEEIGKRYFLKLDSGAGYIGVLMWKDKANGLKAFYEINLIDWYNYPIKNVAEYLEEINVDREEGWIKQKPVFDHECVFITRTKYTRNHQDLEWDYSIWQIKQLEGFDENENPAWYWGLLNGDGEEWGALEDLSADEYFILPHHQTTNNHGRV